MTEDSLTITINNDNENEGNETLYVRLKSLTGAVFASGDMLDTSVTITDDEIPTLTFTGEPFSVAENLGEIEVMVALTGATSSNVSFTYELITGTATSGVDYTVPSNLSGMIQTGSTDDSLAISITNDNENEGNETFTVRLKSLTGAVFESGTMLDTIVTIDDDEDPELSFKTTQFNPGEELQGGML